MRPAQKPRDCSRTVSAQSGQSARTRSRGAGRRSRRRRHSSARTHRARARGGEDREPCSGLEVEAALTEVARSGSEVRARWALPTASARKVPARSSAPTDTSCRTSDRYCRPPGRMSAARCRDRHMAIVDADLSLRIYRGKVDGRAVALERSQGGRALPWREATRSAALRPRRRGARPRGTFGHRTAGCVTGAKSVSGLNRRSRYSTTLMVSGGRRGKEQR